MTTVQFDKNGRALATDDTLKNAVPIYEQEEERHTIYAIGPYVRRKKGRK